MGMEDRDWYRDLMLERQGLRPRWQLWKSKQPVKQPVRNERDNPYYVDPASVPRPWHPVLRILLFVVICLVTFLFLRLLNK